MDYRLFSRPQLWVYAEILFERRKYLLYEVERSAKRERLLALVQQRFEEVLMEYNFQT
jgi:hypothetical protein